MKIPRRWFLQMVAAGALLPIAARSAGAQSYPSRPITIVVPYPPGGPADTAARTVAEHMRGSLGQAIIIENVAGASGSTGVGRAARAAGDGYTLVLGIWNTHVGNGALFALAYDVVKDFEPIALISTYSALIVVRNSLPTNDLTNFIAWLRANPDKGSLGTTGMGSASHIQGIHFQTVTGTRLRLVPYRGSAPAMQDLLAGHIDMRIDSPVPALSQVRAGTIKALAVMAKTRLPAAPEIPTVDEAGLPGFYFTNWNALFAPKGTPKAVITKLNEAVGRALADPAVRERIADFGEEVPPIDQQTPEALAALQKANIEKWWPIIKAANIKPDLG
jgi:tripartite-type tricarboxylate transporter receptor subunit TctC